MKTLESIKKELENAKIERAKNWAKITNLDNFKKVHIIDDNFISIECENLNDVKNVLSKLEPYKTGQEIKHSKTIYLVSQYKIDIENNYYNRKLRFEFEMINGLKFWVNIDFKKMDSNFIDKFFYENLRNLYDTETVYVNIPSHFKKFKNIKIESYNFRNSSVSWYGGNKTLICEETIKDIINYIKSIN